MKTFAIFAFAASSLVPALAADHAPHWTYEGKEGPEKWGDLEKGFTGCKLGKEQSPIDIDSKKATTAKLPKIEFDYKPVPLAVVNNGHTIQVNYDKGSTIKVGKDTYELLQYHFHTPSEEKMDGKPSEMVAHLVHKNAQGNLAVVAVLFDKGKENAALKPVFAAMPAKEGEKKDPAVKVNAADLLPANAGYYTFKGSLTTPPCSEGVRWLVLKTPVTLSAEQADAFRKIIPMNARPVQPLNGRKVEYSGG
jgi:carbonic anhydrase